MKAVGSAVDNGAALGSLVSYLGQSVLGPNMFVTVFHPFVSWMWRSYIIIHY